LYENLYENRVSWLQIANFKRRQRSHRSIFIALCFFVKKLLQLFPGFFQTFSTSPRTRHEAQTPSPRRERTRRRDDRVTMRAARRLASLAARAWGGWWSGGGSPPPPRPKTATGDESAPAVDAPRGVLLRDFIRESLYGRERGYFARATPPVGEMRAPIAFRALAGADDYHRALAGRYAALSSQWLTPVEVFKPHYANAIADYVLRRHAPRRDRPLKVYGAFCFASSSSRASVVRSKSSPEPPRARRARSRVFRLKPPRVVDSDPNASRRPPGRVMSE
jgi:hypothetical protein